MTGWQLSPASQHPECAVLHRVLADLAQRQIIQWRQPPGADHTPLGPVVRCGGLSSADMLVILAPYGYVLALRGTERSGTLSRAQRALLDTLDDAGVVALVVYTQAWFDLVDQALTNHVTQPASLAADAALVRADAIAAASNGHAAYEEDLHGNG